MRIDLDPVLNIERAFENVPLPEFDLSQMPPLPDDWQTQLEKICCDYLKKEKPEKIFAKHIGDESSYAAKATLITQLKIIYHRLQGNLNTELGVLSDDNRNSILLKLTEGVIACTEGFHNRVNLIQTAFYEPKTLAQLLYRVRQSLVENVATALLKRETALGQHVHAANHVTRVANAAGFGVAVTLAKDPYSTQISDYEIVKALNKKFKSDYTAFNLPFLLSDELRGLFADAGYAGRKGGENKEESYKWDSLGKMIGLIEQFFGKPEEDNAESYWWEPYFITEKIDDLPYVYDVNWMAIHKLFFEALNKERFFVTDPVWQKIIFTFKVDEIISKINEQISLAQTDASKVANIHQLERLNLSVYEKIIADKKIGSYLSDSYVSEISVLFDKISQEDDLLSVDYAGVLAELNHLKLIYPLTYQLIFKEKRIKEMIDFAVDLFVIKAKDLIYDGGKQISLEIINKLLLLNTHLNADDLKKNFEKIITVFDSPGLIRFDIDSSERCIFISPRGYESIIVFVSTMCQYCPDLLKNKKVKSFFDDVLDSLYGDDDTIRNIFIKLPEKYWGLFSNVVDTVGKSPIFESIIEFMKNKSFASIDFQTFLEMRNIIKILGEKHQENFISAIYDFSNNERKLLNNERELLNIDKLMMLCFIYEKKYLIEPAKKEALPGVLTEKFKSIVKKDWKQFLDLKDPVLLIHFFNLIKCIDDVWTEENNVLVEAIRACLQKKDFLNFISSDRNCKSAFVRFVQFLQTKSINLTKDIFELVCKLKELGATIRYFFPEGQEHLKNMVASFKVCFDSSATRALTVKVFDKLISQSNDSSKALCYELRESLKSLLPSFILCLKPAEFKVFLEELNAVSRQKIYEVVRALSFDKVANIEHSKIFIIAKLAAYLDSNKFDLYGNNYGGFFSATLDSTKRKVENARSLISLVANCETLEAIQEKISSGKFFCDASDNARKILVRKSAYATCLAECDQVLKQSQRSPDRPLVS